VIGRRDNPQWNAFNHQWGIPKGHNTPSRNFLERISRLLHNRVWQARAIGPFGFQPDNNATRIFEYPWAIHVVPIEAEQTVVDLGGSLGGMQFVLSKMGCKVINVDPSDSASMGWPVDENTIALLNRAFGTNVELRKTFLQDAELGTDSIDRIYCISTIEHVPTDQLPALAHEIGRILKPGGLAVLTIDLFYDLSPFTTRKSNLHGSNIDVRTFVANTGMELQIGEPSELVGYPEFDPETILSRAMEFVQGDIALNTTQALVLRKPLS
jgi:SAM-dependent methyltransferase